MDGCRAQSSYLQKSVIIREWSVTLQIDYSENESCSVHILWLLNFMAKKKERKLLKLLVFCCARCIHYNHKCYSDLCIPYRGACLILNRYTEVHSFLPISKIQQYECFVILISDQFFEGVTINKVCYIVDSLFFILMLIVVCVLLEIKCLCWMLEVLKFTNK